jgi:predicted dehydrogenase
MTKNQIKTALIGCGRIGYLLEQDPLRNKPCTHYGGLKSAGLKVDYACDINVERLLNFSGIAKIPKENLYSEYNDLLQKMKPELVIIATWTDSHAEIGINAARNGAKTIICEKPVSYNIETAKLLINECKKNNTSLIINHERRYDARYQKVKELIDNNKIGEVKSVIAQVLNPGIVSKKPDLKSGGGILLHDGTHMMDIIRYLFGDIKLVKGKIENSTGYFENRALTWMTTESGIEIFLEAGGSRDYFVFELQISGTGGKIIIGNGYQYLYTKKKSKYYTGFNDLVEIPFPKINNKAGNYFTNEYKEAKNSLSDAEINITSSGYDGYKALEAVHAVYLSSSLDGREIMMPVKPEKINIKKIFGI